MPGRQGPPADGHGARRLWPWIRFGLAVSLAAAFGLVLFSYQRSIEGSAVSTGVKVGGQSVGGLSGDELRRTVGSIADSYLDTKVTLTARVNGGERIELTRRKLGAKIDLEAAVARLAHLGKSGAPFTDWSERQDLAKKGRDVGLPVTVDATPVAQTLADLKDRIDRPAIDAKMDLEHRKILPEERGVQLRVIDSLAEIEEGIVAGKTEIPLIIAYTEPKVKAKDLANIDVSTIVGWHETRYSMGYDQSDRTYNLKVAAEKLNGHIIMPGETLSFNQTVGERSEKEGFRTAPVITAGELVDGVGGGTCQISSTLYAAAFFAGLDWVKYTPHSRPSHYIAMGLDSTVVWPNVDLVLKNPYDFPVVIHSSVSQGRVRVELLGKARPYTVAFEREVVESKEFETILRTDENLPVGTRIVDQPGVKGYKVKRHRYIYDKGKVIKHQVWNANYPPTKEFIRIGSKPVNPDDPPAKIPEPKHHAEGHVPQRFRIVR